MGAEIEVEVEVQIASEFAATISAERLRVVAEATLRQEARTGQVTLVVTGDQGIRQLNRDFSGRDVPTDVLAFSAQEEAGGFVAAPGADAYLGDVIVSYPRAAAQAGEQGHPTERELDLLVVHGVLHLLGYDHADEDARATMWARQEAILDSL